MTITARYPGTCRRCGGAVAAGEQVEWEKGSGVVHVACPAEPVDAQTASEREVGATGIVRVTEPGVYRHNGDVFIVKPNAEKSRLYAKKLVELDDGQRLTEAGGVVEVDFVYEPGAIYRLDPEDRLPLDEAKKLTIRYGRCIVCGRRLKDAKSVEAGIGPVCRGYFKDAS